MQLTIHTDGGARGNPGPAAIGVVIEQERKTIAQFGTYIGKATNNVAEYQAVIEALNWVLNHAQDVNKASGLDFFLDSTLVVNQLNGTFKIKNANLRLLLAKIRLLEQETGKTIYYSYVPREQNKKADLLVNQALDNTR